ncbi:uncharacterized protein [Prorops nasuta]|uniref:uncharacterized protein isoform X2 n=1 Tax=Prorops nasuta TaxID=863751 RepID=UPI0034CF6362
MNRIKKRKNRKRDKDKRVLLSIENPWDVKVASVVPVGLAQRRGVSLSNLPSSACNYCGSGSNSNQLLSSPVRTPSPWYKPPPSDPLNDIDGGTGGGGNYPRSSEFHHSLRLRIPKAVDADADPPGTPSSLSNFSISASNGSRNNQIVNSPVRAPSPWYKPPQTDPANCREGLPRSKSQDSGQSGLAGSYWNSPWSSTDANDRTGSSGEGDASENSRLTVELSVAARPEIERDEPAEVAPAARVRFQRERFARPKRDPNIPRIIITTSGDEEQHHLSLNLPSKDCAIDESIEKVEKLADIVHRLVQSRYSPRIAGQGRLSTTPVSRRKKYNDSKELADVEFEKAEDISGRIDRSKIEPNGLENPGNPANSATALADLGEKVRRTSVSMPNKLNSMDDLEIDRQKGTASKFTRAESDSSSVTFSNSGSTPNGSPLGSETEEEANDEEMAKMPLQSPPRRKSRIISSPMSQKISSDSMDLAGVQSANSTITSVNSISSLLKEKLQLSIPQALRTNKKRQNADYRLRVFVGILFLCVVFLVGFAHIYYNQHVLQRAYFDKFRFNKNERVMHVYSSTGAEILAAKLGEDIAADTGVFPCLPHHQKQDAVCLEWLQQTRLYLSHTHRDKMHCYHVTWQSLSPYYNPKDCFDWSPKRGHWYGAGQINHMAYPLERGKLNLSPFISGDIRKHPFGNVLKRYFLNSKGATILVDPATPLYVSINANQTTDFCLQAKHDAFAYINHLTPLPQLNYTICATDNMKSLHSIMAEKTLWDGLKPEDFQAVQSLLSEPVWQISPTNEAAIYNYTEDVIALGFLRQGHVLLSEEWQPSAGDFVLDEDRFPSMEETINIIHRRGFRIVFSIQPFISTESINFKDAVANRLLISERGSDPRIPALTRYKGSNSAGVLDITNNKTLPWLQTKLESLVMKYHVDSFYLDLGTAYDMPHYYKCEQPLTNPDHYKTIFTRSILGSIPVIGVSGAVSRPRAPVFVSLPPFPSSWKAIKTVIPTVLNYGMIGYPFIMPGAVGGDVALPMSDNNPDNDFEVSLPDKELYVRWLQLSTFLPVIRFTHLPSKYSDDTVLDIAKTLTKLRQNIVTPLLKKYANETLDTGVPIIRPLWMLDPADPACHVVVDEFSVGEELIVAPILYSGSRQREVYLPAGVWKDGIDGSLRKGSRWIHNYRVAEDKVAYFVKMPDNTRF